MMAGQPGRSGGRRVGTPGTQYPNRSDLSTQRVQAMPSRQYGSAAAQERAQQAVPLPQENPLPPPGDPSVAIGAPTMRPDEPITAGMPFGPGPGPDPTTPTARGVTPEALVTAKLRGMYQANPTEDMRGLLEYLDMVGM